MKKIHHGKFFLALLAMPASLTDSTSSTHTPYRTALVKEDIKDTPSMEESQETEHISWERVSLVVYNTRVETLSIVIAVFVLKTRTT